MPEADSAANDRVARPRLRSRFAYLPQVAELDRSFPISVYDLVAMGVVESKAACSAGSPVLIARGSPRPSLPWVSRVSSVGPSARSPGGQMQRVLFARLLLQDAELILLDEPFTAIDSRTTRDLLDLVSRWHDEARTVVAVLHDMDIVREIFPETLLIAREPIAWG